MPSEFCGAPLGLFDYLENLPSPEVIQVRKHESVSAGSSRLPAAAGTVRGCLDELDGLRGAISARD